MMNYWVMISLGCFFLIFFLIFSGLLQLLKTLQTWLNYGNGNMALKKATCKLARIYKNTINTLLFYLELAWNFWKAMEERIQRIISQVSTHHLFNTYKILLQKYECIVPKQMHIVIWAQLQHIYIRQIIN